MMVVSSSSAQAQSKVSRRRPVRVVNPGVDLARFDPQQLPTTIGAREVLGLPGTGPIIGLVGRLQRWKGAHVLIHATRRLIELWPDLTTVIVGGPHPTEPDYAHELQALVDRLELRKHVVFAGLTTQAPLWMQAMDVVVHAASDEPFGIVVLEAMALGKPVVAGASGGPSEIIDDGIMGRLVPFGDAARMAAAIDSYLRDPVSAGRIGQAGRLRAQEYSSQHYARRVAECLYELVQRRR